MVYCASYTAIAMQISLERAEGERENRVIRNHQERIRISEQKIFDFKNSKILSGTKRLSVYGCERPREYSSLQQGGKSLKPVSIKYAMLYSLRFQSFQNRSQTPARPKSTVRSSRIKIIYAVSAQFSRALSTARN